MLAWPKWPGESVLSAVQASRWRSAESDDLRLRLLRWKSRQKQGHFQIGIADGARADGGQQGGARYRALEGIAECLGERGLNSWREKPAGVL